MVVVDEFAIGPESLAQFFAGDDSAGSLEEGGQQYQGLRRHPDVAIVAREHTIGCIEFKDRERIPAEAHIRC